MKKWVIMNNSIRPVVRAMMNASLYSESIYVYVDKEDVTTVYLKVGAATRTKTYFMIPDINKEVVASIRRMDERI